MLLYYNKVLVHLLTTIPLLCTRAALVFLPYPKASSSELSHDPVLSIHDHLGKRNCRVPMHMELLWHTAMLFSIKDCLGTFVAFTFVSTIMSHTVSTPKFSLSGGQCPLLFHFFFVLSSIDPLYTSITSRYFRLSLTSTMDKRCYITTKSNEMIYRDEIRTRIMPSISSLLAIPFCRRPPKLDDTHLASHSFSVQYAASYTTLAAHRVQRSGHHQSTATHKTRYTINGR